MTQDFENEHEHESATISERASELQAQILRDMPPPPPPIVNDVKRYFELQRLDLIRRVGEIETLLGFIVSSDDLAARVAKLEQFTGCNRG